MQVEEQLLRSSIKIKEESRLISREVMKDFKSKVINGFKFSNMLMSINQEKIQNLMVEVSAISELLIGNGLIRLRDYEERKKVISKSLIKRQENEPQVYIDETENKYQIESVRAECEKRKDFCKGTCCKLVFCLSIQDIEEGIIKWDYARPYLIAQDPQDGLCVHFDRINRSCSIWHNRPAICRIYDCRNDKRLWIDYEKKIFNPEFSNNNKRHSESSSLLTG